MPPLGSGAAVDQKVGGSIPGFILTSVVFVQPRTTNRQKLLKLINPNSKVINIL